MEELKESTRVFGYMKFSERLVYPSAKDYVARLSRLMCLQKPRTAIKCFFLSENSILHLRTIRSCSRTKPTVRLFLAKTGRSALSSLVRRERLDPFGC